MSWFVALLGVTAVVRGMGAGIIYDVAVVSLALRNDVGVVPYAHHARALFKRGFKTFFTVSMGGALLTASVAVASCFVPSAGSAVLWSWVAFGTTVLAFAATSRALPAVMKLRHEADSVEVLAPILDRFALWHRVSTFWQVASFVATVVALANCPR